MLYGGKIDENVVLSGMEPNRWCLPVYSVYITILRCHPSANLYNIELHKTLRTLFSLKQRHRIDP